MVYWLLTKLIGVLYLDYKVLEGLLDKDKKREAPSLYFLTG